MRVLPSSERVRVGLAAGAVAAVVLLGLGGLRPAARRARRRRPAGPALASAVGPARMEGRTAAPATGR